MLRAENIAHPYRLQLETVGREKQFRRGPKRGIPSSMARWRLFRPAARDAATFERRLAEEWVKRRLALIFPELRGNPRALAEAYRELDLQPRDGTWELRHKP